MGFVSLHHLVDAEDTVQQEWEKRYLVLSREHRIGSIKLLDVVGTIIGGQSNSSKHYLRSARLQRADNFVQVCARVFNSKTTQAIIAAKLNHHNSGFQCEDTVEPFNS